MNVLPQMPTVPEATVLPRVVNHDWYKDAIVYQLHVRSFADSDDDGIGDFNGLRQRLDYLQDLGVTALWLMPFYPSPGRDDGYDIADYRRINPTFGTMADFKRFMAEAKARGLKVITELVINHTSDQHPWFKRARRSSSESNARNWYVWSDTDQKYAGTRIIFTDTEKSNWAWDPVAGAYYWHRFFSHQPDLNYANPQVFSAIVQVMRRWLDAGVDGFRLDAIPYLCEREGTSSENLAETHDVIRRLRAELDSYSPGTLMLAEANQWPEDVSVYFGSGDECHMAYHFPLMPRIYMAIAQEDRFPITDILRQTPDIPANCQWALFLRNHDELTLEMVTDAERDYLWSTYAADPRARINLGIRRRLAPLMENDRRKIELMNSLLLSFPGTPILYYGDEIGMGDNIYLGDRNGVRTPMQWTPDRNGGFSRCDPARMFLPPIMDPVYGYQAVNVEVQARSISSLLSWTKRLIAVRKSTPAFGRGTLSFIRPSNRAVLAYVREYGDETILCVANLSRSAQQVDLALAPWKGRVPIEMIGRTQFGSIGDGPFALTLAPYGFFWLQLTVPAEGAVPAFIHPTEWVTLVLTDGWKSMREGRTRQIFENEVLPSFLSTRRWFAHKNEDWHAKLLSILPMTRDENGILALIEIKTPEETVRYALPLTVLWTRFDRSPSTDTGPLVAPVRRANREGMLLDAIGDREVISALVRQVHDNAEAGASGVRLKFRPTRRFAGQRTPTIERVKVVSGEQSNSTVIVDDRLVVKFYRRLPSGTNPEVEIGQFLTDVAKFANTPPLLGTVDLVDDKTSSLAIVHEFVENQGNAWSFTSSYLDRTLDEERVLTAEPVPTGEQHTAFLNRMRQIGRRIGELHAAFASQTSIADFASEPITKKDLQTWTDKLVRDADGVFGKLAQRISNIEPAQRTLIEDLLDQRAVAIDRIKSLLPAEVPAEKIRHHGDLHLGQILIVKDDVFIIDFEGEPDRSEAERRAKAPSARDVAGILRSLDYAATSALQHIVKTRTDESAKLKVFLDAWRRQASSSFYAGVRETAASQLWPQDDAVSQRLLRFFILEKAIYEIGYELANRPDWLGVPVAGTLQALFGEDTAA